VDLDSSCPVFALSVDSSMATIERLSHVKEILAKSKRVVFPLITPSGGFAGLILTRSVRVQVRSATVFMSAVLSLTSSPLLVHVCSRFSNVMFCLTNAPTYGTFTEAQEQVARDHGEAIRDAQNRNASDRHNDPKDYSGTITRGSAEIEDLWINFTPYMDAGCMTARPQTPAKRLAALFRRVGLSHLCITDKNNIFRGLITRRSLITPPGAPPPADAHGHGGSASGASHPAAHHPASRKGSHAPSVQSISEEMEGSEEYKTGGFSFAEEKEER
jgi:hypothetical protein